jgi:hypothetical protein
LISGEERLRISKIRYWILTTNTSNQYPVKPSSLKEVYLWLRRKKLPKVIVLLAPGPRARVRLAAEAAI